MEIRYSASALPDASLVIELYERAGLPRPTKDADRIKQMFANSDIVITAWDGEKLVGVSRCITDWVWSCYLSDLAVDPGYQRAGIGKRLVEETQRALGEQSMILLLSVPGAMEYYPRIGFSKEDRGFIIHRKK